jgi:DNA-binding NarL/FixJ family response regulator
MSMRQALVSGIGTADAAMADAPLRNKRGTLCPRVLVVEDDAWLAIELERLLDELGCEVCTIVNSAPAAIVAAAVHQPDFVLLDLCRGGPRGARDFAIPTLYLDDMLKPCGSARFRDDLRRALREPRTR